MKSNVYSNRGSQKFEGEDSYACFKRSTRDLYQETLVNYITICTSNSILALESDTSSIMNYMSKNIVSVSSKSDALEVAKIMLERRISSVLLTDETNKIVGIITERDLLREICGKNVSARGVPTKSVMSAPLLTIDMNSSIEDAAKLMTEYKVRHVAVEDKENNELIGVITTSDLALYIRKHIPKNHEVTPAVFEALYCE